SRCADQPEGECADPSRVTSNEFVVGHARPPFKERAKRRRARWSRNLGWRRATWTAGYGAVNGRSRSVARNADLGFVHHVTQRRVGGRDLVVVGDLEHDLLRHVHRLGPFVLAGRLQDDGVALLRAELDRYVVQHLKLVALALEGHVRPVTLVVLL